MRDPSPDAGGTRGRPRSLDAQRAVMDAVRELVSKDGYSAATIEAVAARSGVAKTTIYRWWPNRASLVIELLRGMADAAAPPPRSGDPLRALRTELRQVAEASEGLPGRLLVSLLGEAEQDPDLQEALVRQIFNPRREATARMIQRAQDAGELRRDTPPLVVVDLLFGPLFYRKYVRREALTETFVSQVFRSAMQGLSPPASARVTRRKTGRSSRRTSRR